MGKRGSQRDAAAQTKNRRAFRVGVEQQRHVREQTLRQHVAGIRRIDLAVDRQRGRSGKPPYGDGARRAFAI
jgi:hypothetical protein